MADETVEVGHRARRFRGACVLAALASACSGAADRAGVSFWQERAGGTQLAVRAPSPQPGEPIVPVADLEVVEYRSGGRVLRGWVRWPQEGASRAPLLVYYHGGFALGTGDVDDCEVFTASGFAVFSPALRGENGLPGDHEMFFGELDDALAALDHMRGHPRVDPSRIVVFGHSAGGVLAALAALRPDLGVRDTGSAGAMFDEGVFDRMSFPFRDSPRERRLRVFPPHLAQLRGSHFACVGEDENPDDARELALRARRLGVPLEVQIVPGDHFTALGPCLQAFARRVIARLRASR